MVTLGLCRNQYQYHHFQNRTKVSRTKTKQVSGRTTPGSAWLWSKALLKIQWPAPEVESSTRPLCLKSTFLMVVNTSCVKRGHAIGKGVAAMCLTHTGPLQPVVDSAINEAYPPSQRILGKAHSAGNGFSAMPPTLSGNYKIPEGSSESENSIIIFLYRRKNPRRLQLSRKYREKR